MEKSTKSSKPETVVDRDLYQSIAADKNAVFTYSCGSDLSRASVSQLLSHAYALNALMGTSSILTGPRSNKLAKWERMAREDEARVPRSELEGLIATLQRSRRPAKSADGTSIGPGRSAGANRLVHAASDDSSTLIAHGKIIKQTCDAFESLGTGEKDPLTDAQQEWVKMFLQEMAVADNLLSSPK